MAKAKAKAAPRAAQVVTVNGVGNGSTTLTVTSQEDPTKSDFITVEVLEVSVDSVVLDESQVAVGVDTNAVATITPAVADLLAKGATIEWEVVASLESSTRSTAATVTKNPDDPTKAIVTGANPDDCAVICKVTLDTIFVKNGAPLTVVSA